MQQPGARRSDFFWLSLILALALMLRLIGLNGPLWYDEVMTITGHLRLPWGAMLDEYSMNNHYLFNLQSKLAIAVFGEQNWVVRLPALLFGVGSVAAMWWLARDIAGSTIAHITALLLALSYHHIWFSQNARGYSELAFFGALGMVLFLRGLERPTLRIWLAYGLCLALAVFTHLTGAFLFAAQGGVWLVFVSVSRATGSLLPGQFRFPLLGYASGAALTLILYAPLLPSLVTTIGGVSGTSAVDVMQEYQNPIWSLLEGIRTALGAGGILLNTIAVLVIGIAAIGTVAARAGSTLFAPIVWFHIALTMLLLLALGMRIWPRFFFTDIPFVLFLIVLGVRSIVQRFDSLTNRMIPFAFTLAVISMVALSSVMALRNYTAPKQNLSGAVSYIQSIRAPEQAVYSVGLATPAFLDYFQADWRAIMNDDDYQSVRSTPGEKLMVVAFPTRSLRKLASLQSDIGTRLTLIKRFPGTLGDGAVLVFRTTP